METIVTYETDEKVSIVTFNHPAKLKFNEIKKKNGLGATLRRRAAQCRE